MKESLDNVDRAEHEMEKIAEEIKSRLSRGDEKGAWEKQLELNNLHKEWRVLLMNFFKKLKNNPNFYKPK